MCEFFNIAVNKCFVHCMCVPHQVNGCTNKLDIANSFCDFFASCSFDSYADADIVEQLRSRLNRDEDQPSGNTFNICDIEAAIDSLKAGKAAGFNEIVREHIVYSHPSLIVHLKLLFNILMLHGCVPDSFGIGVVIPLVKDKSGDVSNVDNYRGITLSPIISKLFVV